MVYDPQAPKKLVRLQQLFADAITTSTFKKEDIKHSLITNEIKPSKYLSSHERLSIYNRQYWNRLINTMQDFFIMTATTVGKKNFSSKYLIPYLSTYPSHHYSINTIGERFILWIENFYQGEDKEYILFVAQCDYALLFAYHQPRSNPLGKNCNFEQTLKHPTKLQKHISLLKGLTNPFIILDNVKKKKQPLKPQRNTHCSFYFITYKDKNDEVKWEEIEKEEFLLLSQYKSTTSIEHMCHWLSLQNEIFVKNVAPKLQSWIENWITKEYFQSLDN